jgi:Protein of unknown function (DUF1501)
MEISRRNALLTTLFGAGAVGLRALATGLPVSFLLNPRKALAGGACTTPSKAQFVIFSTSGGGDPINASVPGTYLDSNIVHSQDPTMAPTSLTVSGQTYTAAKPWSTLPQNILDQTVFFHMATNTPIHPQEPQVLQLMGATQQHEMLPSLLAKALAPCLNTIQAQPVAIGAAGPSEALQYSGQTLPIIPPVALKDTLTNPTGLLTQLQPLRDQVMNQIYDIYKNQANPAQQQFVDQMVLSQQQVRNLSQSLLSQLSTLKDNSVASQITAAIALIQMNVSPVVSIHIPFGGDNHADANLAKETSETVSGVASIASLFQALQAAGLQNKVSFMTLNVFGRTIGPGNQNGRGHNENHHVSVCIGAGFKGGVVGGVAPAKVDYGATNIDSTSGAGTLSGDIQVVDTLAAFGQTMLAAVGGDPTVISSPSGKVVQSALA